MLSDIPKSLEKVSGDDLDREILRIGIIAELDAISLYEQLAAVTENEDLKKVLLDIAKEEKTHIGEFEELLKRADGEYVEELDAGKREVEELVGK
ncbi:rubrerythrin [Candidatus Pacearchaeota archaeon]|nr:rubrerythrin [Candidatus Pacearchaeota archaeon]